MNNLLAALPLLIILSAEKCNEGRTDQDENGTTTGTEVPAEGSTVEDAISTQAELTGQRWYILGLSGGELKLPEGAERPWIELTGGDLQGYGGCNNLMGSYTLDHDRLSFSEIGATKMYCPDIQTTERSIVDMLSQTTTYSLDGDQLILKQGGRDLLMLRTAQP